jgi:hypothetical protein
MKKPPSDGNGKVPPATADAPDAAQSQSDTAQSVYPQLSRRDRALGVVRRVIALLLAAGVLAVGIYGVYRLANLSLRGGETVETVQNAPQA